MTTINKTITVDGKKVNFRKSQRDSKVEKIGNYASFDLLKKTFNYIYFIDGVGYEVKVVVTQSPNKSRVARSHVSNNVKIFYNGIEHEDNDKAVIKTILGL